MMLHGGELHHVTISSVETIVSIRIEQSAISFPHRIQREWLIDDPLSMSVTYKHEPATCDDPQQRGRTLVGQTEDGGFRTVGISLELLSLGINSNGGLASQFGYLQMTVECSDGILTDDITLLLLHREGKSPFHIVTHPSIGRLIATQTSHTGGDNQYEEHHHGMLLFHILTDIDSFQTAKVLLFH